MGEETVSLGSLSEWLAQEGFPQADLELQGDLLVLRLPEGDRAKVLGDSLLRQRLILQAKESGFTRVALEISSGGVAQPG